MSAYVAAFEENRPHRALESLLSVLFAANEYITRAAPWERARSDADQLERDGALWTLVRLLAQVAVLSSPALPATAEIIWQRLGAPGRAADQRLPALTALDPTGWRVTHGAPLFPRASR